MRKPAKIRVTKSELEHLEDFVAELNKEIVRKYGGEEGEINQGNLAYSLYKSLRKAKKEKGKQDFHKVWAASTLTEIAQTHPFTDGNKRTSYVTAKLILKLGKFDFNVDYEKAVSFLRKIASRRFDYDDVFEWIEKHATESLEEPEPQTKAFIDILTRVE